MAINFSTASFAACLAAGLKVPRHVMYCIAQDTGTPYVIYNKDGTMQAAPGGVPQGAQWAPQGSPATSYALIAPTTTAQQHFHQVHLQAAPPVSSAVQIQAIQAPPVNPPHSAAPVVSQPAVTHSSSSKANVSARQTSQQNNNITSTNQHNGGTNSNNRSEPNTQQTSPQQNSDMSSYYTSSTSTSATPSHRNTSTTAQNTLSPSSFMSYLKQPGVMLTSINATELASGAHPSGEFQNMPDLLTQNMNVKTTKDLRLFKCETCGRAFRQKSTLLQHERIHTDTRPYPCNECGKRFRQQSHLIQHIRIHANEKPYNYGATINATINAVASGHVTGGGSAGNYKKQAVQGWSQQQQQECSYPTSDKDSGYDNSESGPACYSPETNATFPAYFKDEKGVNHGIFNQAGKCLPDVIQNGKTSGMPLYVRCPICQKEFKQKSTLLQHGCVHIESRPYPCGDCGKRFRQQSHLVQHLRIHNDEKPYTCIYCGRQFRQRTILNQHTRIHTGEKPHKCDYCGKCFRQKPILEQHVRIHTGEKPHECDFCGKCFRQKPILNQHLRIHTGEKPHKCQVCGQCFRQKPILDQHLRIHTGEKPYKCIHCGKDFRQKAILDQHTRTHQGERPFCCPLPNCRRRFCTEGEVKRHIDNHMTPNNRRTKARPGSPTSSLSNGTPVIKPELYFSHSYASGYNVQYATVTTSPQEGQNGALDYGGKSNAQAVS
uniref:Zinc finger protein 252 n=1 Tax=Cacopsylla melanoneura TaxID=428564 RepID=A0A8D9DM44_9HEMI